MFLIGLWAKIKTAVIVGGVCLSIGLTIGYATCLVRGANKAVAHQQKQSEGVNTLQKGVIKDVVKTVKVVQYIKTAPDTTKCGKVRARASDISAVGGVLRPKDR